MDVKRVLVVDDNPQEQALYERLLGHAYDCQFVVDANDAIDKLRTGVFDACVADYNLAGCTAELLLQHASSALYGTPIVVVTAAGDDDLGQRVIELGAAEYFPKNELTKVLLQRCLRHVFVREQGLKLLRRKLREDNLTVASSRHCFMEQLSVELSRCRRYGRISTLAMFDIDGLDELNKKHGSLAGDFVLKVVAQTLLEELRMSDLLGRIGGDEFAVLLAETNLDESRACLQRLRSKLAELQLQWCDQRLPLSVTIGAAEVGPSIEDAEQWITLVDEPLALGKQLARGEIYFATEAPQQGQRIARKIAAVTSS